MRILRVAHAVYPDVTGGAAYHVHAMSRDQAAMGHDVTTLTIRRDPDAPRIEARDGYAVVRFDPTVSPLGNDVSAGLARYLFGVDDVDVVHAHSHLYFATNLAAARRVLDDTPLAITNHGLFSQNAPERLFEWYVRSLGRATLDRADVVFCYTDVDARRLREYGVSTDVAVVPNGIDLERFTPEGPESDLIDADRDAILFVGRLVEGKRPQDAIRTVERVRERRPDATLYVCGDGPLREALEERASGPEVEFLGQVPYDEMPTLYRSADVLLLPSRAEGVPRTVLEAQAAGVPVVATDLAQLRPVATARDRLVPARDVASFAAAVLDRLDGDSARGPRPPSGPERAWNRTVERTTRVLSQLAGGRR